MLDRILGDLKNAPEKLADRGAVLKARARSGVHWARGEGRERLWALQIGALERAEDLLHRAPDVPVVGELADAAERLVHRSLEATTAVPLDGYDDLGAKKVIQALRGLDRLDLLRIRRHEAAHKNRKTVIAAVDRELARRSREVEAAA